MKKKKKKLSFDMRGLGELVIGIWVFLGIGFFPLAQPDWRRSYVDHHIWVEHFSK